MKYIFGLIISVILLSCSKEYSCENNCMLKHQAAVDTTQSGAPPTELHYNYYLQSYDISLAGTGNNEWGYSIPQFDTAKGILDTVEVNVFTTVSCYFELTNNSNLNNTCSINFSRKFDLLADSLLMADTIYHSGLGPVNVIGWSTLQDSVNLLNNIKQTSIINTRLDMFIGNGYTAFAYDPKTNANTTIENYNISAFFHDSTYIQTIYHFKKQI